MPPLAIHIRVDISLPGRGLARARLGERMIKSLHQLHPPCQEFVVGDPRARPAFQHFVYAEAFLAAEFLIQQVRIVDDLPNDCDPVVSDWKRLLQGFERAILAPVPKAAVKHVEGHCLARNMAFGRKSKPSFRIDVTPDEPGRSRPIDSRPRSRHPNPSDILSPAYFGGLLCRRRRPSCVG